MLRACDRLYNICIQHYRTLRAASRALGYKNETDLCGRLRVIRCNLGVHFLCRLCRHFNVSLQSLFFNDNNKFTIKDITYKNFIELYKSCECKDSRCSACITALKAGKCSTIPMKYLIFYSKRFGKTIDFLLKG